MTSQVLRDDGWPRSDLVAGLARRINVVRWFRLPPRAELRTPRLAAALRRHAERLPEAGTVTQARLLGPAEGRELVGTGRIDPRRHAWQPALDRLYEDARDRLLESGRGRGHPLLAFLGRSVRVRRELLPVDAARIRRLLAGTEEPLVPAEVADILADRVLFELGAMLVWEMVGDLLPPNPFTPLLEVYEEGCYPLDLSGGEPVLWAPETGSDGARSATRQ